MVTGVGITPPVFAFPSSRSLYLPNSLKGPECHACQKRSLTVLSTPLRECSSCKYKYHRGCQPRGAVINNQWICALCVRDRNNIGRSLGTEQPANSQSRKKRKVISSEFSVEGEVAQLTRRVPLPQNARAQVGDRSVSELQRIEEQDGATKELQSHKETENVEPDRAVNSRVRTADQVGKARSSFIAAPLSTPRKSPTLSSPTQELTPPDSLKDLGQISQQPCSQSQLALQMNLEHQPGFRNLITPLTFSECGDSEDGIPISVASELQPPRSNAKFPCSQCLRKVIVNPSSALCVQCLADNKQSIKTASAPLGQAESYVLPCQVPKQTPDARSFAVVPECISIKSTDGDGNMQPGSFAVGRAPDIHVVDAGPQQQPAPSLSNLIERVAEWQDRVNSGFRGNSLRLSVDSKASKPSAPAPERLQVTCGPDRAKSSAASQRPCRRAKGLHDLHVSSRATIARWPQRCRTQ